MYGGECTSLGAAARNKNWIENGKQLQPEGIYLRPIPLDLLYGQEVEVRDLTSSIKTTPLRKQRDPMSLVFAEKSEKVKQGWIVPTDTE